MTLTGIALVLALAAVAWIALSVVVALGLSALVARNRTTFPVLAPAQTRTPARAHEPAHAA